MISSQPVASYDDVHRLRAGAAVSWGAIIAGAAAAVAISALLLALGAGFGFASISPWAGQGASAGTFAISGAIWLIVTQWLSAGIGGYLAGRLRHRWLGTHAHEVFFRDTAHGFVTWAVATLVVVALAGFVIGDAARAGAGAAGMGIQGGMQAVGSMGSGPSRSAEHAGIGGLSDDGMLGIDRLFRTAGTGSGEVNSANQSSTDARAEVLHIASNLVKTGDIPPEDRTEIASLVAAKTGVSNDEAQKRVDSFIAQVKDAEAKAKAVADAARKAAAQTAIYTALAMLIGAFIASVAAAIGGRLRDEHA